MSRLDIQQKAVSRIGDKVWNELPSLIEITDKKSIPKEASHCTHWHFEITWWLRWCLSDMHSSTESTTLNCYFCMVAFSLLLFSWLVILSLNLFYLILNYTIVKDFNSFFCFSYWFYKYILTDLPRLAYAILGSAYKNM